MKIKLIIIKTYSAVAVLLAVILFIGANRAWGGRHRPIPRPAPTPTVQWNSAGSEGEEIIPTATSETTEVRSKNELIDQLQDLHDPIRVLIYQGNGPIKINSVGEPSPSLYPPSCQLLSSNLIIDGLISQTSEYEIKLSCDNGKIFSCTSGQILRVGQSSYRGCIKVECNNGSLYLVNYVSLEDYLRGVVPKELLCSASEAIKAQAVVARTYAWARRSSNKIYDVDCGTTSQVYGGASVEAAISDQAVADTVGQVLTYQGKLASQTLYHSSCGGSTENPLYVYGAASEPYLTNVSCTNEEGEADCAASPYSSWQARWSKTELGQELGRYFGKKFSPVAGLEVVEQGPSGRISKLMIHFEDGSSTLLEYGAVRSALRFKDESGRIHSLPSAKFTITEGCFKQSKPEWEHMQPTEPILGQVLDLLGTERALEEEIASLSSSADKSEFITVAGQGWGHGVGMCQWGAIGMAKRGESYLQILARYFVDTQIESLENLPLAM